MTTSLMQRLLFRLSGHLPCRIISDGSAPYLERYFLGKAFGWQFYLHRFVASDPDRGLHDHPWRRAVSLVLAGGYTEERLECLGHLGPVPETREVRPGRLNIISNRDFHRVLIPEGREAWTIFGHGRYVYPWGFLRKAEDVWPPAWRVEPLSDKAGGGAEWWLTAPKGRDAAREALA